MENQNTTLTVTSDNGNFMVANSSQQTFCSIVANTVAEKKHLYNIINSPDKHLKELINMELEIQHVYAETCEYVDQENGDVVPGVRIVLVDAKGVSYATSSKGVFNCLSKMFSILGAPDQWDKPIKVKVRQISTAPNKSVLLLDIVE